MRAEIFSESTVNPYVSVIVPVFNGDKTIARCLHSVQEQSFSDWECIVIDDGSTDNTSMIIKQFAEADNRIIIINNHLNLGVSESRNRGIDRAIGEWITFLDADDYLDRDYLERLAMTQKQYQTDLTMCEFTNIGPEKGKQKRKNILDNDYYAEKEDFISSFSPKLLWNNEKERPGGPVCKLYSKKIIYENKIYFKKDVPYNEDLLFNLWYFQFVSSFYYIHESLYYRLLHEASAEHIFRCGVYGEVQKMLLYYQELKLRFQWKYDTEKMFFFHVLVDLPFRVYICKAENTMPLRAEKREYYQFLKKPDIYDKWESICLSDCIGLKKKIKYVLVKTHQFYLLKEMCSKWNLVKKI